MSVSFGSDFFAGNRQRLCQLFTGKAPIVMTASGSLQKIGDEAYPFKQDSSFWYLTGIDLPDVVLVIDKGREYLIVPERDPVYEAFEGVLNLEELARRSGVDEVLSAKEGWKRLEARLKRVRHVATLAANPAYIDLFGMYTNPARRSLIRKLRKINSDLELLDLRQHIGRLRMVKQPLELEAIQEAIDNTCDTLREVTRPAKLSKYAYEYQLEADLTRGFRYRGGDGNAFAPVVAIGQNACTLHGKPSSTPLTSDEFLILDVGASSSHYCSDISRTLTVGGKLTHRQQQVFQAVAEAQDYAFSLLKPGVLLKEYEKQMEAYVGEKLRELGLIKSISHEAVRDGFFPHATSHFLGLDTHDVGDYDHPLEAGVVLAVEPGIYIRDEGIGVRIEDNVVITEDGCRLLSTKLPRTLTS